MPRSWLDYTKGDYGALPGDDDNLETSYTEQEVIDVATKNDVRVSQCATATEYTIHQYKDFVGTDNVANLEWEGQTNSAAIFATVFLQIYNYNTLNWDIVDSNNTSPANTDFILTAEVMDLTDYKDPSQFISCRIYQLAV